MSVYIGKNITISLYGESHGDCIGVVVDGLPSGILVKETTISEFLSARRPKKKYDTKRIESDDFAIISGLYKGHTNGCPLNISIKNSKQNSSQYPANDKILRPSTADYTILEQSNGYGDIRGGGHSSARLTAPLCAVGAICSDLLQKMGIDVVAHILQIGDVLDDSLLNRGTDDEKVILDKDFPLLNTEKKREFEKILSEVYNDMDSIGGKIECGIFGYPLGIGGAYFDGIEGKLAQAIFAIPAVKAVEFGLGTDFATSLASKVNDTMRIENAKIKHTTNNSGGILGGISNGEPIIFSSTFKPIPSIRKIQNTVNYDKMENAEISCSANHDTSALPRAAIIVHAITAIVALDLLLGVQK